jgi:predicted transcriptional regulator
MTDELPGLGELERDVMLLVWKNPGASAETIREKLGRPLKEATIRTVLRRLEEKGYVTHTTEGRTFFYSAAESRPAVAARAVKRVVDWFCNGSVEDVLVHMVKADMIDAKQLKALSEKIASEKNAKQKGKKS